MKTKIAIKKEPTQQILRRFSTGVLSVLVSTLGTGCGSKLLQTSPSAAPRIQNAVDASDNTNESNASQSTTGCSQDELPADLKAKGFKRIDVNKLALKTPDNNSKSLCQFLTDSQNKTAIVQFSGVLCLSCQEEAKDFSAALGNKSASGNEIGHIVALTDFWEDFTKDEFKKFMTQYAPLAIEAHDPDITLWKYFSKDPSAPTRPTIVTYDRHGWAYIINSEDADPSKALSAAQILADKASADVQPQNPQPSEEPDVNDDQDWVPVPVPSPIPNPSVNPSPSPSVNPTPSPGNKPINLAGSKNVSLTDASGGKSDLQTYFENNDYLVIDLSQYNCVYCRQLASKHNSDSVFQSRMQNGKCKTLTVVPNGDLSSWIRAYPSSGFTGKTSRGISSLSGLASAYGVNFGGTPTVFMIDRTGKIMGQQVGGTPSQIASLCQ
jgi:thioredoxin-related protein